MHIGIIGHMGHGKTTMLGRFLYEHGSTRFHPAETLRKMLIPFLEDLGYSPQEIPRMLEGDLKRSPLLGFPSITPTTLQQDLGTAWGRNCVSPEIWNHILTLRLRKFSAEVPAYRRKTYNDSIRFPNEVTPVISNCGYLIKITRPGQPVDLGHASESSIPLLPYHFEIFNTSDYTHVAKQLAQILSNIERYPYEEFSLVRPD